MSNNNGPLHQDFVPHVARISKLMKTKVEPGDIKSFSQLLIPPFIFQLGRAVPPRPIVAGEPLLTMRAITCLEDLAPWFSTLSLSLTRQQTRSLSSVGGRSSRARSPLDTIERIIEIDFMEEIPNQ